MYLGVVDYGASNIHSVARALKSLGSKVSIVDTPDKFKSIDKLVFPGQGSQVIGMGADLYEKSSIAKDIFDEVDETLGQLLVAEGFSTTDLIKDSKLNDLVKIEGCFFNVMSECISAMHKITLKI